MSEKAVMDLLSRAAERGEVCPSNRHICVLIGAKSVASSVVIMDRLARKGLILIDRYQSSRVVTIVATGKSTTAPHRLVAHWRLDKERKAKASVRLPIRNAIAVVDEVLPEAVDRDPCPRCGVRADIGCRHSRAPISMGAFA